jgi:cellobiose transport system permease protein
VSATTSHREDEAIAVAEAMTVSPESPRRRRRSPIGRVRWWTYFLLIVAVLACVFPLYWMFVVATAGNAAAHQIPPRLIPGGEGVAIAQLVFTTVPFVQSLINSAIVATTIGVGTALLCSIAGFAFAKLHFPGRDVLFVLVIITMTVPMQLAIIPQYMVISAIGWVDTLQALIVPGLANAFGIFWMRQHIGSTVSDELMQAAKLDGAGTWQIFWQIVFPVVRPAAFVLGLLNFVSTWNDFLWPFIVLKTPELFTVQLAIRQLQNSRAIDLGLAMAGSFLATIPLLIVFFFVGRRLVSGIMDGAFKG